MPQIFRPRSNTISRVVILSFLAFVVVIGLLGYFWTRAQYVTGVETDRHQPVPFSHKHHVGGLGLDCRYCHASVEVSSDAGMPPTKTCVTCHSRIWADSPMLAPVRESLRSGTPIAWQRVIKLPDYVYFHHGIHLKRGIDCSVCHGDVARMPLMRKARDLEMNDCLACHRDPAGHGAKRPLAKIAGLTDCYVCHR